MDQININYIQRFNDSNYELVQAEKFLLKQDTNDEVRCLRNASEAISQSLENALKAYLNINLSRIEKSFLKSRPSTLELIGKFIDNDGSPSDYFYVTIDDTINPSVNFTFLKERKGALTNWAKHEGALPDKVIIENYIMETRKFILQYLNDAATLKSKEDFTKVNTANWDLLYSACDRFNPNERVLILLIGPNQNIDEHHLQSLGLPKWNLIIDFDYNSEKAGFYKASFLNQSLTPHKLMISDNVDVNSFSIYSQTHYHLFANNYAGSGATEPVDFNDWNKKYSKKADLFIKSFAEVFSTQKTVILSLFNSRRYVDSLCRIIHQHFGDNALFVFANDLKDELNQVAEDWNGLKVNISLSEISEGIDDYSSNFGSARQDLGRFIIPHMELSETKTSGELTQSEFAQYEEYFEVVHKGLPTQNEGELDRREFLIGAQKLSWYGIQKNFDTQKKNFQKAFIKPLERIFENTRGKISLVHDPGFGGTTVSRRIAWHFHNDYPTLILKSYKEGKVRELLINLHQKTRKTIFVILEVPQAITLDEVESLYKSIPQARPVIFLVVKRGKPKNVSDLVVNDWGNDIIDLINSYKPYVEEYDKESIKLKKFKEFDDLLNTNDPMKKTPFYVGLLTFDENFFAIKDYVKKFCLEVIERDEQKKVLLYLALCEDYVGQGLPSAFFKKLFKVEHGGILNLEKYFSKDSGIVESLLTSTQEGVYKFWKIRHNFLGRELKIQLLSGMSDNPEIWKQGLSELCSNFIWDSVSDGNVSQYIEEILQKLFIGNRRDRAGTDFTQLINDIDSLDGKERVFKSLKDAYPENPHYCSHLARFYAYHNKNRELALKYANEAISLSLAEGNEDPLLYHIKGMCLRSNIYDIMDRHILAKQFVKEVSQEEYYNVIENLVPECEQQFEQSRTINKKNNKLDEYGFIAHIQLLVRAIDYGIIMSGKPKIDFLKNNSEPFSEWLDNAESLLEEVKRINFDDDESGKIEDCSNEILKFYEDYDQILQNLRNQLDKGKNPARVRRQIVRTYIRKKSNYQNDSRIIESILTLMEANIENEPDNEKNFYLWFQAARYSKLSLDAAIDKVGKWKANSNAVDAVYYFYILKVIRALQGYSESAQDALNLIRECKQKGKSNIVIYEWLGKGNAIDKLVSRNNVDPENKEDKLALVEGYFTDYSHDGSGKITIADRLEVFFSPTQAKLSSGDLHQPVEFFLGFSYDGLRADSYSVRIRGNEPRNKELIFESSINGNERSLLAQKEELPAKDSKETKVLEKIDLQEKKIPFDAKRQTGKIIDLQRPPRYMWGKIENQFGNHLIFHRDNEKDEIFDQLEINSTVSFETKKSDKGLIAYNIEVINED